MKKFIVAVIIGLVIGSAIYTTKIAQANRSYFVPSVQTATATTSPYFLGVNNAYGTTTVTLDAYTYSPVAINSATLLVQSVASTSASVQKLYFEYSQDGIDWFQDNLSTTTSASVIPLNNTQKTYSITGNTLSSTTRMAISVPTPTRYVRATINAITASSSAWMQFIPVREMVQ